MRRAFFQVYHHYYHHCYMAALVLILGPMFELGMARDNFWNASFDKFNTPSEEIIQYFEYCPAFQDRLQTTCKMIGLYSCAHRCGQAISHGGNNDEVTTTCSCDVFCDVFHDCCWDYDVQCPDEKRRLTTDFPFLQGANTACIEDSIAVIAMPDDHRTTDDGNMIINPLVSETTTGLTLKSIEVYTHYFQWKQENTHDSLHYWKTGITRKSRYLDIQALIHVFKYGFFEGMELAYIPPPNLMKYRRCKSRLLLDCINEYLDDNRCQKSGTIQIGEMKEVCFLNFNPSNFFSTAMNMPRIHGNFAPEDLTGICHSLSEGASTKKGNVVAMRILFAYLPVINTFEIILSADAPELTNLRFQCRPHGGSQSPELFCDMILICKRGYMFVDLDCRRPWKITVEVVWKSNDLLHLFSAVTGILDHINNTFPDTLSIAGNNLINNSSLTQESSGLIRLECEMEIVEYDIHAEPLPSILPVSESVSSYLKDHFGEIPVIQQVELCFVMEIIRINESTRSDWPKSCDRFRFSENFVAEHKGMDALASSTRANGCASTHPFSNSYRWAWDPFTSRVSATLLLVLLVLMVNDTSCHGLGE